MREIILKDGGQSDYFIMYFKIKINMNNLILFSLIIIGLFLYSCDPNGVTISKGNYWERSNAAQLNIKGKVKTITTDGGSYVTSFNESGFITSDVYNEESSIYIYNANGQLAKIVKTSPNGTSITTIYEYNNPGRYIFMFKGRLHLYPNLSSYTKESTLSKDYTKVEYVFKNATTMDIITTNVLNSSIYKDSSTVQYNGNYPSGYSNQGSFLKDITYASNGMFKTYTDGFNGNSTVHKFKSNDDYLLPESDTFTYASLPPNNSITITYTYNDKNDLTEISGGASSTQYINFVYDSQGNWTSNTMQSKFKDASTWTTEAPTVRTITYW